MHATAHAHMKMCIDVYMPKDRHYKVLDLGSRLVRPQRHATHRTLLEAHDHEYLGADINAGHNVDLVMKKPYRIPAKSNTFDVAMSGQAFEHIPFPWVTFLEMCRVVKPGGLIFVVAPSRGQRHGQIDCWRYYPDSMRALAAISRVNLLEAFVDLPPSLPSGRPDYAAVPPNWWGDAVGVFRKPEEYSRLVRVVREVNVWWANRVGGVDQIETPAPRPRRVRIGTRFAGKPQPKAGRTASQPTPT